MSDEIKKWSTQIKKGYLELCILSLIQQRQRVYGFHLLTLLSKHEIPVKEGTLYPLLSRMTKEGLLAPQWETEGIKGHPRKFYRLTKAGEQSLEKMMAEFKNMNSILERIRSVGGKDAVTGA
ncbi:MAG: PadR family transcriptional regulator [Bdellovibrionales bacterium]|nr:PadR family transcriptional regulator [Bdellovibrionales bacterium]